MMNIINKKMVAAIEKKLGKKAISYFATRYDYRSPIKAEVITDDGFYKAYLIERTNLYGTYYRVMSVEKAYILQHKSDMVSEILSA